MEISEIKAQLTLSRLLQHYGLKPDKHGRLHCPFHDDKTPREVHNMLHLAIIIILLVWVCMIVTLLEVR